jgi:hypothetical protein
MTFAKQKRECSSPVAPSVNAKLVAAFPGVLNDAAVADIVDGASNVQLGQQVLLFVFLQGYIHKSKMHAKGILSEAKFILENLEAFSR